MLTYWLYGCIISLVQDKQFTITEVIINTPTFQMQKSLKLTALKLWWLMEKYQVYLMTVAAEQKELMVSP